MKSIIGLTGKAGRVLPLCCVVCGCFAAAVAQESYELPKLQIHAPQVANQTPVGAFTMPISGLRFDPRVDVQERNLAEGQADVAVRGGLFENTGFKLGGVSLYDPQTGHYFAEIPVAPAMLRAPRVLTGATNAITGFNAEVATVAFGWRPISRQGEASVAFGDYASNRQSLYQGIVRPGAGEGRSIAADFELSRSESDGSVPFGDHKFERASGRVQIRGRQSQTDFFAGAQRKFFGWPNLYTPFGFNETEYLKTRLYVINHRVQSSPDNYWQLSVAHRRNFDDYEFNRAVPGASNPFRHSTRVTSASLDGHGDLGNGFAIAYNAQAMRDHIDSTSLTFGRFNSREYFKLAVVPQREFRLAEGRLTARAGAAFDDTNRDSSDVSPIIELDFARTDGRRVYVQYSESTQVPTYTALNSSATGGLFRGNPDLGRETSRNLEIGANFAALGWRFESALFHRRDDDLVDWTFRRGVTARSANAVSIGVSGWEIVATRRTTHWDLVLGYTYLNKDADYGRAAVDASFYALNFARHRLTAAVVARLGRGFELRVDNEFRVQEKNMLRTAGGDDAVLSTVGLYYLPPQWRGVEFSAVVDNVWDDEFQQVPAVPAARRQFSIGAARRW